VLDDLETRKDTVQVAVESAFQHVGQIAGIITGAGREITRELGDWATDLFEMREAARRARVDRRDEPAAPGPTDDETGT
jgi:hypothetical protein